MIDYTEPAQAKFRVAVARDVIANLNSGIAIERGRFLVAGGFSDARDTQKSPSCRVCGVGACFISMLALQNKGFSHGSWGKHNFFDPLLKHFSPAQIYLIEAAFEQGGSLWDNPSLLGLGRDQMAKYDKCQLQAVKLGSKHEDPKLRLKAICKNIIKNKGWFRP